MTKKIRYTTCPVCGSASLKKVLSAKDYTVSGESFEIFECGTCSLRFTQDIADEPEIGKYYKSDEYISHTETRKGIVNKLYHLVRRITLASKRKFIESVTHLTHGSLLDIGAGTGAFVHYMQSAGWEVTGLEKDNDSIQRASSLYKVQLLSTYKLFQLPAGSFDVITMWHVLEHVHALQSYLEQLARVLKPGGYIFIAVPNYTSHDAQKYGSLWAAYDVPRHLYHFSPESMKHLLERKGFNLKAIKPMWFDSFYVSLLSEKYKSGKTNLITGFWNGLLSNLKAFRDPDKASSIIYVVTK